MELKELRKNWERGLEEMLTIAVMNGGSSKVFVILRKDHRERMEWSYSLHRYMNMNHVWQVSVDLQNCVRLEDCLEFMNKDKDVRDSYRDVAGE